jgi:hypothetical protein
MNKLLEAIMKSDIFIFALLILCSSPPIHVVAQSPPCETKLPLYSDKENKPFWLDSIQLKKQSRYCEVPKFPPPR